MADSQTIHAIGGKEPVDESQRELEALVRAVLAERVRMGLELPGREVEMIAGFVATRGRWLFKKLFFQAYQAGSIHGADDQNEIPTRPVRITREMQAQVAAAKKPP